MQLYLLRHADAEPHSSTGQDRDRVLCARGIQRLKRTLQLARTAGVHPAMILSSPYTRAVQTAKAAAQELGYAGAIVESAALTPDSSPFRVWEALREQALEPAVLMVAHEPLLSSTVAWLAGSTRVMVRFVPAALARIDFEAVGAHPAGVMQWMVSPDLAGAA